MFNVLHILAKTTTTAVLPRAHRVIYSYSNTCTSSTWLISDNPHLLASVRGCDMLVGRPPCCIPSADTASHQYSPRRQCRACLRKQHGELPPRMSRVVKAQGLDYKQAGVDIDAGAELVRRIQKLNPSIGGFSGLVPFGRWVKNPITCTRPQGLKQDVARRGFVPGSWDGRCRN